MSHPVADYLHELYLTSGVSVPETSTPQTRIFLHRITAILALHGKLGAHYADSV